jgi:hypothetical protein
MKPKRQKRLPGGGLETSRVLAYAFGGVAKEVARLLKPNLVRRRKALVRRGETGISKRDVFRFLPQAFSRAMLDPRGDEARAPYQRSALAFVLAAADVPSALHVPGTPMELLRARKWRNR